MNNQHRRFILLTMFVTALVFPGAGAALGQTFTFTNPTSITVNDGGTEASPTASTPYGTTISVASLCCVITRIEVSLNNFTDPGPENMDVKLVGPTGIAVDLFRDAGGGAAVFGQTWTFDDRAAATAPDAGPMSTGTYKPTVVSGETGNFPAPAPAGVQSVPLSKFIGTSPNGTWTLYVAADGFAGGTGFVAGGWSMSVTVGQVFSNPGAITIPLFPTSSTPYPSNIAVSGVNGTVTKVTAKLNNFSHSFLDDVAILLVGPSGQRVRLTSDNGSNDITLGEDFVFDDTAANPLPDGGIPSVITTIRGTTYSPSAGTVGIGDGGAMPANFPAPAPANPYAAALSSFNGVNPNGTWSLYVYDDSAGGFGSIAGGWTLAVEVVGSTLSITTPGPAGAYSQNFDVSPFMDGGANYLLTDNTPPNLGWYAFRTIGNVPANVFDADSGFANFGVFKNYGIALDPNRALGSLATTTDTGTMYYGLRIQNDTGFEIQSVSVQYTGEQWRASSLNPQSLSFGYQISSGDITSLTAGAFTSVPALTFTTPINTLAGEVDGNLAANRVALSKSINVSLPSGSEIMLRWEDVAETDLLNHGFGIDDVTVTFFLAPTAAPVSISGRATTASGVGISNAILALTGGPLSEPLIARTNPFGYYQIDGVPAGGTYLLEIGAKRYRFVQPSLVINAIDSVGDADFIAESK